MVAEASALTGSSGLKPEGGLTFDAKTATVRTIAVWAPATTRILSDAPSLRQYIDGYLTHELGCELEDQVIAGDGTGQNFEGVLTNPNVQTAGPPGALDSMIDVIREAITLVQVNGRTDPTGIVLHPADAEVLDLLKVNDEANHYVGDVFGPGQRSLFGVRLVITDAVPQGTAIVGDWSKAVLFDRQSTTISVGTVNDDFARNIVRVL